MKPVIDLASDDENMEEKEFKTTWGKYYDFYTSNIKIKHKVVQTYQFKTYISLYKNLYLYIFVFFL